MALRDVPVAGSRGPGRRHSLDSRCFTPIEALAYESLIASALSAVTVPALAGIVGGRELLDVGCGGGTTARALAARGRSVIGVDASSSQVRRFERHSTNATTALVASAERLPFASGRFDDTYSTCAFKHWRDQPGALRECARVTRQDGRLVVIELDGAAPAECFARFATTTRVPRALTGAYVAYSMRTVMTIAPTMNGLHDAFALAGLDASVERLGDLPFLLACATVP